MKIDEDIESNFPGLKVIEIVLHNLEIKDRDPGLNEFKHVVKRRIMSAIGSLEQVKDQKVLRAYRDFYWCVGIDPTKTRPAGEALVRRIIGGNGLPTINTFVDSYNLASSESYIAIGAFDLSKINHASLRMRKAKSGETFLGIGMEKPVTLSGLEIVIQDERKLIAIYPYRDSEDSKVTLQTRDVLLLMCGVPGINDEELEKAALLSQDYIGKFCTSK